MSNFNGVHSLSYNIRTGFDPAIAMCKRALAAGAPMPYVKLFDNKTGELVNPITQAKPYLHA